MEFLATLFSKLSGAHKQASEFVNAELPLNLQFDDDWVRIINGQRRLNSLQQRIEGWYDAGVSEIDVDVEIYDKTASSALVTEEVDTSSPVGGTSTSRPIPGFMVGGSFVPLYQEVPTAPAQLLAIEAAAQATPEAVEVQVLPTSQSVAMELRSRFGIRVASPANVEMGGRVAREILSNAGLKRSEVYYMSRLAVNMWLCPTQLDQVLDSLRKPGF